MYWVHNSNQHSSNEKKHITDMKKNYNVPATEVVAFMGSSMVMAGSPGGGGGGGGEDPTTDTHSNPNGANFPGTSL